MIRFETDRLIIRDVTERDLDSLRNIYTCEINMKYISSGRYDWTKEELEEKYRKINQGYIYGFGIFAVELRDSGDVIGEAGLFDSFMDRSVLELGYIVDSAYWNQGYGTEICGGLIDYALNQLSVHKLIARMYVENTASVRLAEKLSMERTVSGQTDTGSAFYEYVLTNDCFWGR